MSSKFAKKIRKMYKKDLKSKLIGDFNVIKFVLKTKPKWFPVFIWANLSKIFIDHDKLISFVKDVRNGTR